MKKKFATLTALALTLTLVTPAMGADLLISPAPAPISVEVDGTVLDLTGKTPYTEGEIIMVPVRAVAEALGYTVTWTAEQSTEVLLDNGVVKTTLHLGEDSYFMASSKAIGMSNPAPLGAAPVAVQCVTFVPMDLFGLLGNGAEKKDMLISFTKEKGSGMTQIPNPMKAYDTIEAALAAAGLTLTAMPSLPKGYQPESVYVIGGNLLEVNYVSESDKISFRAAKGESDVSGDYNVYTEVKTETIGTLTVTTKGAEGKITLATWQNAGMSFSLRTGAPVALADLSGMLGG